MSEANNSRLAVFSLFMTGFMLSYCGGYQFVIFNPITPILQQMFNNTYMSRYGVELPESTWIALLSVTLSSVIIGGFIGASSIKALLGCMSRKRLMQTAHVINLFSILIVALVGKLTESYEVLIIGRIITGFPIGIMYTLTPLMVAEMSARNKQGMWQGMLGVGVGFGLVVGSALAHPMIFGNYNLWPIVVAMAGVPSIIYLISSFWIPNTVFYVMRQGDRDATMTVLKQMRTGNKTQFEDEYEAMQEEMKGSEVIGIMEIIKNRQYRFQFIAALCVFANLMLCGVNNFTLYSDRIFLRAGIAPEQASLGTIGVFLLQFITSIIGTKMLDRYGGRKVILVASCLQIFALLLFIVSQATLHLAPHIIAYLSIVATAIFFASWSGGTNLASMALIGAVTIEPTRPSIFGYGGMVLWLLSWFVGFIPPYLEIGLGAYSMVLWLVFSIIFLVYFIIFMPEVKGRTVEEIQAKFLSKRHLSSAPLSREETM